ncbi:MAG: acyl-CoA dehydrogenase [Gammaproteobacteria bacterium]
MNELTAIIETTANGIFDDNISQEMMTALEEGELNGNLWEKIEEAGLTKLLLDEDSGGAGGDWLDAEVVLRASGRHRVPAPVGEAIAAHWVMAKAAMPVPDKGVLTWAIGKENNGQLTIHNAPWASQADHVLIWADNDKLYLFEKLEGLTHCKNIAGEPRASGELAIASSTYTAALPDSLKNFDPQALGALVRAVQMSGALDGALHMAVNYASERIQFGRTISKFQAIQQQLALMSGHVASSVRAAGMGCEALARDPASAGFDIAVAKVLNSEAVEVSTSIAHQVHAAIGITFEYKLNFFTRRLWSWRDEYGSDTFWAEKLGAAVVEVGGDALWGKITDHSLQLNPRNLGPAETQ